MPEKLPEHVIITSGEGKCAKGQQLKLDESCDFGCEPGYEKNQEADPNFSCSAEGEPKQEGDCKGTLRSRGPGGGHPHLVGWCDFFCGEGGMDLSWGDPVGV